jgi:hypothetical protein
VCVREISVHEVAAGEVTSDEDDLLQILIRELLAFEFFSHDELGGQQVPSGGSGDGVVVLITSGFGAFSHWVKRPADDGTCDDPAADLS